MKRAFTIVELLTVVAIVGVLGALLLPVVAKAKMAGKRTTCLQNLRSLHLATTLYQGDADDLYPFASNPFIRDARCASGFPHELLEGLCEMPDVVPTLAPYVKANETWHCPLDSGLDVSDLYHEPSHQNPTSYASSGSSYWYNDELAATRRSGTDVFDSTKAVVFFDRTGAWHGSGRRMRYLPYDALRELYAGYRYQAIHVDGHIGILTGRQINFGLGAAACDCRWLQGYQTFL